MGEKIIFINKKLKKLNYFLIKTSQRKYVIWNRGNN